MPLIARLLPNDDIFEVVQPTNNARDFKVLDPTKVIFNKAFSHSNREELIRVINNEKEIVIYGHFKAGDMANFVEALKQNSTLTSLVFFNTLIGPEEAQILAQVLETNTSLSHLEVRTSSIGDKGVLAFAQLLRKNSSLTHLVLSEIDVFYEGNWQLINSRKYGPKSAQVLAEALQDNSTLTYLDLSGNLLGYKGAESLARALEKNSTLTHLNIEYDFSIKESGAKLLAKTVLDKNKSVIYLNLGAAYTSKRLFSKNTLNSLNSRLKLRRQARDKEIKSEIDKVIPVKDVSNIVAEYLELDFGQNPKATPAFLSRLERFIAWLRKLLSPLWNFVKKMSPLKAKTDSVVNTADKTQVSLPSPNALAGQPNSPMQTAKTTTAPSQQKNRKQRLKF